MFFLVSNLVSKGLYYVPFFTYKDTTFILYNKIFWRKKSKKIIFFSRENTTRETSQNKQQKQHNYTEEEPIFKPYKASSFHSLTTHPPKFFKASERKKEK